MGPSATPERSGSLASRSLAQPVERGAELSAKKGEIPPDPLRAPDHHMVGSSKALGGDDLARERTEAPLHPVADDGAADLLGDGEADPHARILVIAVADEQDEPGHRCAQAAVGGKKVRALLYGG